MSGRDRSRWNVSVGLMDTLLRLRLEALLELVVLMLLCLLIYGLYVCISWKSSRIACKRRLIAIPHGIEGLLILRLLRILFTRRCIHLTIRFPGDHAAGHGQAIISKTILSLTPALRVHCMLLLIEAVLWLKHCWIVRGVLLMILMNKRITCMSPDQRCSSAVKLVTYHGRTVRRVCVEPYKSVRRISLSCNTIPAVTKLLLLSSRR